MNYVIISIIFFIMLRSIWQFIHMRRKQDVFYRLGISFELFYTLIVIYGIVMIGFGLIYFLLSFYQVILVEIGEIKQYSIKETLYRSFYFSGVTMLTIGYGDIIPIGIGRFIAVTQALIGYLLPTTFVLKLVHLNLENVQKDIMSGWIKDE